MNDIFLSYSRTDKPSVAPLVAALEAKGWDVWWDMALAPGEEFDNVTGEALESARSVLVVWTPTSVASRWVRGEARVGADRNVLVPVRFGAAQLPIDLRAIQTIDLDDWGGDPQSVQFQALHQSLVGMLGAPSKAGPPCVGRAQELERVRELIAKGKRGEGGFLLFSGEAGVGKTRMTLEAERAAKDAGYTVLRGHCSNMESPLPFQPAVEQIEQSARQLGSALMRRSMGENAAEICRLVPELRHAYDDIPDYPALPPEQERRYLLHGIAAFVARGATRQPIMLIYEDLHWADESTCVLLAYVAERLKNEPVVLVGAYRDGELGGAPFGRVLQDLMRKRLAEDLRLRRLSSGDIVELLSRQFGSEPPASLVELIFSKTEGNPFFVEEVVRHLHETDRLLTETGKFRERIEVTDAEVTRGVRLILEDRIGLAGTHCREVLTTAAVVGRSFVFDLLVKADSKHDEDDILDAIEEAERKNLIEDVSRDRVARYRFVHEQVRQTLLAALSLPRRQRLHLRIADALEAGSEGSVEKFAGDIGHHLYQAGSAADPARTAHHLGVAGERAMKALAFEDALRQFDLALGILEEQGDAAVRARLHGQRSEALRGAERFPEALDALARAAALAPTPEGRDEFSLRRCQMLLDIWRGAESIGDLQSLLARAQESGDPRRELEVQRVLSRAYYVMSLDHRDYAPKCKDAWERTIELARAVSDRKTLGHALVSTATLLDYWPEYRDQVEKNLAEAMAISRDTGDEDIDLDATTARLGALQHGLAVDEERVLERLIARRDPIRLNAFYFRMMWSTLITGRLERCVEICDAGIELAYRIGTLPVQYPTIAAFALMDLGRFDEAWASLEEEIADEAHRFGAALRDMGKMIYEIHVGAFDAALNHAPHVIAESHALVRAWMLRWVSSALAGLATEYAGDEPQIARIEALVASTGMAPGALGDAALALAHRDAQGARAALDGSGGFERAATVKAGLTYALLRAQVESAAGVLPAARDALSAGVAIAREKGVRSSLWRLLAEQAQIESAMGAPEAVDTSQAARALWAEIGRTIPDTEHRAGFLRGRLAERLGLSR